MANSFAYNELVTQDTARARDFYRKLFDWKVEEEAIPGGGTYTMFYPGEGNPGGMRAVRGGEPAQWITYMKVDDTRASTKRARELGAQVQIDCMEIPEGVFSILHDPTGATFGLWQPKKG